MKPYAFLLASRLLVLPCILCRLQARNAPFTTGTTTTVPEEEEEEENQQQQQLHETTTLMILQRPPQPPPPPQKTPTPSDWSGMYAKTLQVVHEHTPAGWIDDDNNDWEAWDGQVIDPTQYPDAAALADKVCPGGNTVLGQRKLFYQHNPFDNVLHPSKADVDEWNRFLLQHIRRLFGYTGPDYEIEPDVCLYALAMWNQERQLTTLWDSKYPVGADCKEGDPHACDSFYPTDMEDQRPYLPEDHPGCELKFGTSAGILTGAQADLPWSIVLSRVFCTTLRHGGFWSDDLGPFFRRTTFGLNFWDMDPTDMTSTEVRIVARWGGTLQPHLYPDPSRVPATDTVCVDVGESCQQGDVCCEGTCIPTFRGSGVCYNISAEPQAGASCVSIGKVCYESGECCDGSSCITTRFGKGRCYYE
mmetsp:Transcript_8184/g.16442  ORF Transcript_8184/g.16442 Transcript_8184/m.16442 type:complete len:417 (+) Transcript_8184:84-1334(+)|eukprot:scaffold3823_cov195-Amphora_coffeaeformis.AAC.10